MAKQNREKNVRKKVDPEISRGACKLARTVIKICFFFFVKKKNNQLLKKKQFFLKQFLKKNQSLKKETFFFKKIMVRIN